MGLVEVGGSGIGVIGAGAKNNSISVNWPNIPLFLPLKAQVALNDLALKTLKLALQLAAGALSNEVPVDTGGLAQSFGADPSTPTGGTELMGVSLQSTEISGRVFSSLPYAIVMDQGRRPGAPISRDGIDAIGLWAQRKLGLTAEAANSAKWAIAQTIVAQGIEGHYYVEAAFKSVKPSIDQMFAALGQEIATQLTGGKA